MKRADTCTTSYNLLVTSFTDAGKKVMRKGRQGSESMGWLVAQEKDGDSVGFSLCRLLWLKQVLHV